MGDDISVDLGTETSINIALTGAVGGTLGGQHFHFQDVRAADIDYIHAGIVGTGAEQVITTNITNPDVARNASITVTNINTPSGVVTIAGVNIKGVSVTEEITIIAGSIAYGNVAWATITSVTLPAGVGALDTVKVGISDKLGLPVVLSTVTSIIKKKVNDEDKSSELTGNVDIVYCTVDCAIITEHADITISTKERSI